MRVDCRPKSHQIYKRPSSNSIRTTGCPKKITLLKFLLMIMALVVVIKMMDDGGGDGGDDDGDGDVGG